MSDNPNNENRIITHPIAPRLLSNPKPHIGPDIAAYKAFYAKSVGDGPGSDKWWADIARETLYWDRPFKTVRSGGFANGDVVWFPEGGLNASYNCVDRWAMVDPDRVAIIYEADEPSEARTVSYGELLREVYKVANVLKSLGLKKSDTVSREKIAVLSLLPLSSKSGRNPI